MTNPWQDIQDKATELRRSLHQRPERTWAEFETAKLIRAKLDDAGISWRPCAETGTIGVLAPGAPGRHVALRADIDALPIVEASGVPWASAVDGCMHACGHDGHTATLFAAAWMLKRHEADLTGPVSLLFQPAEEGGHGAKRMIEDGALDGVDVIFGWHNWPAIPFGKAVCPDGVVMAANGTFRITIKGHGGHASQPEATRDPVLASAATTVALQQIVSRRLSPMDPAVVSVASIEAPSMDTIIPSEATIGGSIRLANEESRQTIEDAIRDIAGKICRAHGVEADVEIFPRYGSTVNHAAPSAEFRMALSAELGPGWKSEKTSIPIMASEDFSYYLREVPGAFALIGADDGKGHNFPCHSPRYDFNDRLIGRVARLYCRLAGLSLSD